MKPASGHSLVILAVFLFAQFPATVLGQDSAYIPWKWRVKPDPLSDQPTEGNCPSTLSILLTFAVVNILVSIISLITGHRKFIEWLSCGYFNGEDTKITWFYMFLLPLGLNLGSNALIAYLYQTTPGFGHTFTIWQLTLFYTTRPRLSWIVLVVFMNIEASGEKKRQTNYIRSAKAAVAAEVCLVALSSYYMGKTAHFAAQHNYYSFHNAVPSNAETMYAGALLSLITILFTIICLVYILFSNAGTPMLFIWVVIIGCTSWLASWVFLGGFVSLSGTEYCPPRLWQSGLIWTGFSVLGTFFGGAG